MPSTSTNNQAKNNMKSGGGARKNNTRGRGRGGKATGKSKAGGGAGRRDNSRRANNIALPEFNDAPIKSQMGGGKPVPSSKAPPAAPKAPEVSYSPAQLALRTLLIGKVGAAADNDAAREGAKAFAKAVAESDDGVKTLFEADGLTVLENDLLGNKKNPVARVGGLFVVEELATSAAASSAAPLLKAVFAKVLALASDKKEKAVRLAAKPAAKAVLAAVPASAVIARHPSQPYTCRGAKPP